MFSGQGYGVFGYYRLTSRRMGSDENTISHFESIDCFFLEIVQLEGVLVVSSSSANGLYTTHETGRLGYEFVELIISWTRRGCTSQLSLHSLVPC